MPRTVLALMLREMATTYGRRPGGYLWAVFEPVAALAVLVTIFGLVMRAPPMGVSFPLFYATGYLPFVLFSDVSGSMARALRFSRPLLSYPAVTFVDALLARLLVEVLTHLVVGFVILAGILLLFDTHTILNLPRVLEGVALATVLGLSVGVLNCYLMTSFPVWESTWQIATRPLFLVSGILFLYEDLPRFAQEIMWWNPVLHIVTITRTGFYATYTGAYASATFVLVVSGVLLVPGLLLLYRYNRDLLQR